MLDILHRLEATGVGTMVRESLYGFPILVGIHLMGLLFSVGMILWFDLRLLGLALGSAPVSRVYRRLIPWATAGYLVMVTTGAMLFTGFASAAYQNPFFRIKVSALVLAGANALFYHLVTERGRGSWDDNPVPPPRAPCRSCVHRAVGHGHHVRPSHGLHDVLRTPAAIASSLVQFSDRRSCRP